MKLNETYKNKHSLKETVVMISHIYGELMKMINQKFKPIHLDAPVHNIIGSEIFADISERTRKVTYDLGVDYNIVAQYTSNSY